MNSKISPKRHNFQSFWSIFKAENGSFLCKEYISLGEQKPSFGGSCLCHAFLLGAWIRFRFALISIYFFCTLHNQLFWHLDLTVDASRPLALDISEEGPSLCVASRNPCCMHLCFAPATELLLLCQP